MGALALDEVRVVRAHRPDQFSQLAQAPRVQGSVQAERALDCRPRALNERAESGLWEQRFELMRLGEHWIGRSLMYEPINASI
jgi:hypothetical protein